MRKLTPAHLEPPLQGRRARPVELSGSSIAPQKRRTSPRDPPPPAGSAQSSHCRMPISYKSTASLGPHQPELANANHGQCPAAPATRSEPFAQQAVHPQAGPAARRRPDTHRGTGLTLTPGDAAHRLPSQRANSRRVIGSLRVSVMPVHPDVDGDQTIGKVTPGQRDPRVPGRRRGRSPGGQVNPQLTAFYRSAAILASSAAVGRLRSPTTIARL
jgi:hypothetical protein